MTDGSWTVWADVESVSTPLWKDSENAAKRFVDEQRQDGRTDIYAEHDNGTQYPEPQT